MNEKSSKDKRSVIMSDKYLSESGIQGGKVLGDHISLLSIIVGIPFLIIGSIALLGILPGYPTHLAGTIGAVLVAAIGLLLVIGGYNIYTTKQDKK